MVHIYQTSPPKHPSVK